MSTESTIFEKQIQGARSKTWYWLTWDGSQNVNGDCNKKLGGSVDKELYEARKRWFKDLNSATKSSNNKAYIWFWDTKAGRSIKGEKLVTAKNVQKIRSKHSISVRIKGSGNGVSNYRSKFSPSGKELAPVKIGIKRFNRVKALMLRIYKDTKDTTPNQPRTLVYQEVLDSDAICRLPVAQADDGMTFAPSQPPARNGALTLAGDGLFLAEVWVSERDQAPFDDVPANLKTDECKNHASFDAGKQRLHDRAIRDGGKKQAIDLAPMPTISIQPGRKLGSVQPKFQTWPAIDKDHKTYKDFFNNQNLSDKDVEKAVKQAIDDKVYALYQYIRDAAAAAPIQNLGDGVVRILVLPEWFFIRTVKPAENSRDISKQKVPAGEQWFFTEAEKNYIFDEIKKKYAQNMESVKGKWIIMPGTILWGKQPGRAQDRFGQSIVFNTACAIWKKGKADNAEVHFMRSKTQHGNDTPLNAKSAEIDFADESIGKAQLNDKIMPSLLKKEICSLRSDIKNPVVKKVITADASWLVEVEIDGNIDEMRDTVIVAAGNHKFDIRRNPNPKKFEGVALDDKKQALYDSLKKNIIPDTLQSKLRKTIGNFSKVTIIKPLTDCKWLAQVDFDGIDYPEFVQFSYFSVDGTVTIYAKSKPLEMANKTIDDNLAIAAVINGLDAKPDAQNFPRTLKQELEELYGGVGFKNPCVSKVLQNGQKWMLEVKKSGQDYYSYLIAAKAGNKLKLIPKDYFSMNLRNEEWAAWLGGDFKASKDEYNASENQSCLFTAHDYTFALEICAESEMGVTPAIYCWGRQNKYPNGMDCHIVASCGMASTQKALTTAADGGCILMTNGHRDNIRDNICFSVRRDVTLKWSFDNYNSINGSNFKFKETTIRGEVNGTNCFVVDLI